MQGYTCVQFADICRLCATNCGAVQMGIFDEQGVRLGLQNKLEKLVDIKVRPEDNLPKVMCCKCVMKLEEVQNLRNIAQSSEVMLNNFYERAQNFNHFKLTGMVYIQNNELRTNQGVGDKPINVGVGAQVEHREEAEANVQNAQNMHNVVQLVKVQSKKKTEQNPSQQTMFKIVEVKGPSTLIATDQEAQQPPDNMAENVKNEVTKTLIVQVYKSERMEQVETGPDLQNIDSVTSPMPTVTNATTNDDVVVVRKYVCGICGKRFRRREHLFQHTKLHSGVRPWKCKACPKAFMRKEHLLRHEILHTGQKDFSCELCLKSFARHDNLLKHRKIHQKDDQYTCPLCGKVFVLQRYYDQHMRTAHDHKLKVERNHILHDVEVVGKQ